jgi:fructose-bisphosphate aldolase class II
MHGGSGVSTEDYHKAVEAGVRKINYFTYMDKSGGNAVVEYLNGVKDNEPIFFSSIYMAARAAMQENVKNAMQIFALRK